MLFRSACILLTIGVLAGCRGETRPTGLAAIKAHGGEVVRDKSLPGSPVVQVSLSGDNSLTDAELEGLGQLTELRELNLGGNGRLGHAWCKELRSLHRLRSLQLNYTPITDAGLAELAGLTELESLGLAGTSLRGPGLRHLKALEKVHSLRLENNPLDDAGLNELPVLPNLQKLWLIDTQITDAGVKELRRLPNLRQLDLGKTGVTDACLKELVNFPNLIFFAAAETRVTPKAVYELRRTLPHLQGSLLWVWVDSTEWPEPVRLALARVRALGGSYTIGRDHLERPQVIAVSLANCPRVTDKDLTLLRGFVGMGLATVDLRGTGVTDAGVAELQIQRGPTRNCLERQTSHHFRSSQ